VHVIDGTDYYESAKVITASVQRARNQKGPTVVVAKVPRIDPHSFSDDPRKYRTEEDIKKAEKKDPLKKFEKWALERKMISPDALQDLKEKCFQKIENAAKKSGNISFSKKRICQDSCFQRF